MISIEQSLLQEVSFNSISGALDFLDSIDFNLNFFEVDGKMILFSGEKILMTATSEDELNAFVLGMALGYAILPEDIFKQIVRYFSMN